MQQLSPPQQQHLLDDQLANPTSASCTTVATIFLPVVDFVLYGEAAVVAVVAAIDWFISLSYVTKVKL